MVLKMNLMIRRNSYAADLQIWFPIKLILPPFGLTSLSRQHGDKNFVFEVIFVITTLFVRSFPARMRQKSP